MEANISIINKMIEQYGVQASQEAKQALVNFAVLYGQKLVRACISNKEPNKAVTTEQIRSAYEVTKKLRSPEYEAVLEQRKKASIKTINEPSFFDENDKTGQQGRRAARSAVTVKLLNCNLYHMSVGKEQQLTYE